MLRGNLTGVAKPWGILRLCLCACAISSAVVALARGQGTSPLEPVSLSQTSTFVFTGTVKEVGASTMPQVVPASPKLATVQIESIHRCSTNVCGSVGNIVTVQLLANDSVRAGEEATFFTTGWLVGSGTAVKELALVTPPMTADAVNKLLAEGADTVNSNTLQAELASAKCVITGKVLSVTALNSKAFVPGEHAPKNWQDAKIQVLTVEKSGCLPQGTSTVDVVFPLSKDVELITSPTFTEGQTGIWILNPIPNGKFKTFNAPSPRTFTSLKSDDFKPLDELNSVRAAMKKQ